MTRWLLAVVLFCAAPTLARAQAPRAWDRARGAAVDDERAPAFAAVEADERARVAAAHDAALVEVVEVPSARPPRHRTRRNYEYAAPGIAMFVGGWVATAITTSVWYSQETHCTSLGGWFSWRCTHDDFGDVGLAFGWVPLVGPWLMMIDTTMQGATRAFPVIAGLVQDVGFVLMLLGLLDQHDEVIPARAGPVQVLPYASTSGLGLLVDGRF